MRELLIIGAGPAGLSAAIAAREKGIDVQVIDEFPRPGGRLLGQLYQMPDGEWWNGIEIGEKLYNRATGLGVDIDCGVSVFDLDKKPYGWDVYTTKGKFKTKKLLLATGSSETPSPIPGWTLPGVMSIGAAQVMSNVHRVKPGNSCVIVGVNVLSLSIANELRLSGITVKEMILPRMNTVTKNNGVPVKVLEQLMDLTHLAPSALLRQLGKLGKLVPSSFAIKFYPKNGIKMFDIPIRIRKAATEIIGEEEAEGVRTVDLTPDGEVIPGSEDITTADFVCIAGGLNPLVELAAVAGCQFKYIPELGGHVPVHNERMETNIDHLYVAGNITGIENAEVAMAQGKVAGLTISSDLKKMDVENEIQQAMDEVRKIRGRALIQFHPGIQEARERLYSSVKIETLGQSVS